MLDDILVKVDRCSMLHSLEVRAPFLDTALAEFTARLPVRHRLHGFQRKYLLKKAFADLLPQEILRRGKRGFQIPVAAWLRGRLRPLMEDMLSADRLQRQGIFNPRAVQTLMRRLAECSTAKADGISEGARHYLDAFYEAMFNDLKAPQALAALWSMMRDSDIPDGEKWLAALEMDSILGLSLEKAQEKEEPQEADADALALVEQRSEAKKAKNYALADEIRARLASMGYKVVDTPKGATLEKL